MEGTETLTRDPLNHPLPPPREASYKRTTTRLKPNEGFWAPAIKVLGPFERIFRWLLSTVFQAAPLVVFLVVLLGVSARAQSADDPAWQLTLAQSLSDLEQSSTPQALQLRTLRLQVEEGAYLQVMDLCEGFRRLWGMGPIPYFGKWRKTKTEALRPWLEISKYGLLTFVDSTIGNKAYVNSDLTWDYQFSMEQAPLSRQAVAVGERVASEFFGSLHTLYLINAPDFSKAVIHCLNSTDPKTLDRFVNTLLTADFHGGGISVVTTEILTGALVTKVIIPLFKGARWIGRALKQQIRSGARALMGALSRRSPTLASRVQSISLPMSSITEAAPFFSPPKWSFVMRHIKTISALALFTSFQGTYYERPLKGRSSDATGHLAGSYGRQDSGSALASPNGAQVEEITEANTDNSDKGDPDKGDPFGTILNLPIEDIIKHTGEALTLEILIEFALALDLGLTRDRNHHGGAPLCLEVLVLAPQIQRHADHSAQPAGLMDRFNESLLFCQKNIYDALFEMVDVIWGPRFLQDANRLLLNLKTAEGGQTKSVPSGSESDSVEEISIDMENMTNPIQNLLEVLQSIRPIETTIF